MAKVNDVRMTFRFRLTITDPNGAVWNELECEKVELPNKKLAVANVGAGNYLSKVPGMEEIDNLKISKIRSSAESDKKIFDWYNAAKNKGRRNDYARTITLAELDADMITVLNTHVLTEVYPVSVKFSAFDRTETGGKVMEEIEFSVDKYEME